MNIGKVIKDFYCNGFFGRRYDLENAIIEGEGKDWIVIRIETGDVEIANFNDEEQKNNYIKNWT